MADITIEINPNPNITIELNDIVSDPLKVPYTGATSNVDLGVYNLKANKLKLNTTPTVGTLEMGDFYWDTTNHTVSLHLNDDVNLQIGQELQIYVRNNTNAIITNGSVVYQTGVIGGHPTIALAIANDENKTFPLAVATQNIAINDWGYCTTFGKVRDLNTNAYNENDELYLSATNAGNVTTTPPASPNFVVKVGSVTIKNPSQGEVLVGIQNPMSNNSSLGTSAKFAPTQTAVKSYVDNNKIDITEQGLQSGEYLSTRLSPFSRYLASGAVALVSGSLYGSALTPQRNFTVTNLNFAVTVSGAGGTVTLGKLCIATISGSNITVVASTANDITMFTGTGIKSIALTSPYNLIKGTRYFFGVLGVNSGWTTAPQIVRAVNATGTITSLLPILSGNVANLSDLPVNSTATTSLASIPYIFAT